MFQKTTERSRERSASDIIKVTDCKKILIADDTLLYVECNFFGEYNEYMETSESK